VPPAPPAPPAPAPPAGHGGDDDITRLRATLDQERQARKDAEVKLATAQQAAMTDQEKAVAAARAEGKAEAEGAASRRLAAAEFRVAASGRLANPDGALAALDLSKLVGKDGEPDRKAIAALVDQLAPPQPQQTANGHVIPAGARTAAPAAAGNGDWLRSVQRGPRGVRG
jgi:hypothetical protein